MKLTVLLLLTACVGTTPDDPEADLPVVAGDMVEDASAIAGCSSVTTVLLYSEETYELTLPNAFAAAADRCTRYYVDLPHQSGDPTMPRPGADKVHALGANVHAMAEFSWSGWAQWIAQSPGTRDWALAGKTFRQRMVDAGYDVAAGDTWVINEFPSSTRTGDADVWTHERSAVKALYAGDTQGVVFLAGMGQTLQNFAVYKPNVAGWLEQDAWWADMSRYVRWFGYEVYADPHDDCAGNVAADADHLDDYLEHVPRLAVAGGARTQTAAAYLARSYVPLVNAAWNSDGGFGNNVVALGDFEKFSRLQIYATHLWASGHAYPGRRIGFAWSPKNATTDQQQELADVIANSVARAYPAGGFYNLGKYACSTSGSLAGCGCTITGAFNNAWQTFATW